MSNQDKAIDVFFYGLFMDDEFLKDKGLTPINPRMAYLEGYKLMIAERATLIESTGEKVFGVIMSLPCREVKRLYQEASVADYLPEEAMATLINGDKIKVQVYNLPKEQITGSNKKYAQLLVSTAQKTGLPQDYIQVIETFLE